MRLYHSIFSPRGRSRISLSLAALLSVAAFAGCSVIGGFGDYEDRPVDEGNSESGGRNMGGDGVGGKDTGEGGEGSTGGDGAGTGGTGGSGTGGVGAGGSGTGGSGTGGSGTGGSGTGGNASGLPVPQFSNCEVPGSPYPLFTSTELAGISGAAINPNHKSVAIQTGWPRVYFATVVYGMGGGRLLVRAVDESGSPDSVWTGSFTGGSIAAARNLPNETGLEFYTSGDVTGPERFVIPYATMGQSWLTQDPDPSSLVDLGGACSNVEHIVFDLSQDTPAYAFTCDMGGGSYGLFVSENMNAPVATSNDLGDSITPNHYLFRSGQHLMTFNSNKVRSGSLAQLASTRDIELVSEGESLLFGAAQGSAVEESVFLGAASEGSLTVDISDMHVGAVPVSSWNMLTASPPEIPRVDSFAAGEPYVTPTSLNVKEDFIVAAGNDDAGAIINASVYLRDGTLGASRIPVATSPANTTLAHPSVGLTHAQTQPQLLVAYTEHSGTGNGIFLKRIDCSP